MKALKNLIEKELKAIDSVNSTIEIKADKFTLLWILHEVEKMNCVNCKYNKYCGVEIIINNKKLKRVPIYFCSEFKENK